jgi:hypothetical protein
MKKKNKLRLAFGIFSTLAGIGVAHAIWQCQCSKGDMVMTSQGDTITMSCSGGGTLQCVRP